MLEESHAWSTTSGGYITEALVAHGPLTMENQLEKNMENEMETANIYIYIYIQLCRGLEGL